MNTESRLSIRLIAVGFACALLFSIMSPSSLQAQVIIQRSAVGTAQSALIQAQADFVVAQGINLKLTAQARQINAAAVEHEMKNSVLWIHTYFERRRLNREYREQESPGFQELQKRRTALARKIIEARPEMLLQGDITNDLNMMIQDMLANVSFDAFLPDSELMAAGENLVLTPEEIHHLLLSENKDSQGRALKFRADQAEVLEVKWPTLLRQEEYNSVRKEFESARDAAIETLKAGKDLTAVQEKRLMDSVDALSSRLADRFNPEGESAQRMLMYLSAKRYIQSLAVATYRIVEIGKDAVASDSRKFKGKTVVELLQHMMSQGLEFAAPEAGDEGTYRKMFSLIRSIYLKTNPGAAATAGNEKDAAQKEEKDSKQRARSKDIFGK
jgi:hypothetical protein